MINPNNSKWAIIFNSTMEETFRSNVERMNRVLNDVELTEQEEKTLLWLCENDSSTIQNVVTVLQKVKQKGRN